MSNPLYTAHQEAAEKLALRLIELGFVAGEPVEIIAEARPGGDPIAVRIGGSHFALRRREAAAVMVTPLGGEQADTVQVTSTSGAT
mgnify:CR=1 FL=1